MQQYRIKVEGVVQGVGYRQSALLEARRLALKGWVKNQPDGSVLIKAQGEKQKLERFVGWCHEGPVRARVHHIDVSREEADPAIAEAFEIRF